MELKRLQSASIPAMATLYVRNVPAPLYAKLVRWAEESGRSVNNEMIALLENEAERRKEGSEWWQKVLALQDGFTLPPDAPRAEDIIREDRDHGHSV
jgi:plasmid stability protein